MSEESSSKKLYYSIGEVADLFGVNTSMIRYWEKEFDILKPKKNKKGNRLFTAKDLENLKVIHHLLKDRGFTIDGAKKKLRDNKEDTVNQAEVVVRLQEIRKALMDIKKQL
mgnify:FL=1|jgi:DNA-binding transcriptional MerR regulator